MNLSIILFLIGILGFILNRKNIILMINGPVIIITAFKCKQGYVVVNI
jgi:NADH:ubiquinone oxidoreductase subunit K